MFSLASLPPQPSWDPTVAIYITSPFYSPGAPTFKPSHSGNCPLGDMPCSHLTAPAVMWIATQPVSAPATSP